MAYLHFNLARSKGERSRSCTIQLQTFLKHVVFCRSEAFSFFRLSRQNELNKYAEQTKQHFLTPNTVCQSIANVRQYSKAVYNHFIDKLLSAVESISTNVWFIR